jgi:hypothetical protein
MQKLFESTMSGGGVGATAEVPVHDAMVTNQQPAPSKQFDSPYHEMKSHLYALADKKAISAKDFSDQMASITELEAKERIEEKKNDRARIEARNKDWEGTVKGALGTRKLVDPQGKPIKALTKENIMDVGISPERSWNPNESLRWGLGQSKTELDDLKFLETRVQNAEKIGKGIYAGKDLDTGSPIAYDPDKYKTAMSDVAKARMAQYLKTKNKGMDAGDVMHNSEIIMDAPFTYAPPTTAGSPLVLDPKTGEYSLSLQFPALWDELTITAQKYNKTAKDMLDALVAKQTGQ